MTVIQPNKSQNLIHLLFIFGSLLVVVASLYVFVYSNTVSLKYDIEKIEVELERLRVDNAELKNDFYSAVDSRKLEELAKEKGLIYDKNPQWEFASQF